MTRGSPLSRVSLIVITLNEEDNIGRCLSSASGVGEIIVVDSYSADGTAGTAERRGATVYQRNFVSAADQKNWAMTRASLDWILILDADEALSPQLHDEMERVLSDPRCDGYTLKRRNTFFGKRIRFCGWHDDRVLRLFRRGAGTYPERAVHEKLELAGTVGALGSYLDHRPYRDLADYIDRMKSYSGRGAQELYKRGGRWFPAIVTHTVARFIRMYVFQLGFLDGAAGLVLCALAATSVFFKYATLRELQQQASRRRGGGG